MPRIARVIIPDTAHHITQRGNRRQKAFFRDSDYAKYLSILKEFTDKNRVEVWAYCLMPNHVHLIAVPRDMTGLTRAISEVHRRYTFIINRREGWSGHLWQGRFSSTPMDDAHLLMACRYVEQNPVRAGLCSGPEKWRWSSARCHLGLADDPVVSPSDILASFSEEWMAFLEYYPGAEEGQLFRKHESSGRPLGDNQFILKCESLLGRSLRPGKRGPRSRS